MLIFAVLLVPLTFAYYARSPQSDLLIARQKHSLDGTIPPSQHKRGGVPAALIAISEGSDTPMKMRKKGDLPTKTCAACGRPFAWRKKWARDWDQVRYCSERCRRTAANKGA